jgi:hypothetical protein
LDGVEVTPLMSSFMGTISFLLAATARGAESGGERDGDTAVNGEVGLARVVERLWRILWGGGAWSTGVGELERRHTNDHVLFPCGQTRDEPRKV